MLLDQFVLSSYKRIETFQSHPENSLATGVRHIAIFLWFLMIIMIQQGKRFLTEVEKRPELKNRNCHEIGKNCVEAHRESSPFPRRLFGDAYHGDKTG